MAHEPFNPVPEVTPTGPAGNYENIQANPSQFGGLIGAAEQRFGAQGEAAGNTLFQGALARQQWQNEVNTDAAFNQLQAGYQKLLHGDPDKPNDVGFYGLRGQDAVNAYKPTSDAMENLRTSLKNSLTSPMAQLRFDTESRRLQMFTTGDMGRHYDNESGHVAMAVNQATEDINLRQIELNPADEDNYQRSLDTATKGAIRRIQTQYGLNAPPEVVNSALDSLTSKAVVRRALAWGERGGDPAAAMSWLETQRQHVDPTAYDQVVNHLKGKADDVAVSAGIDEAAGRVPSGTAKAPPSGVFPPSASAPWIENKNDGTTTTSQYVDKVMARYRQNGGDIADAIKNGGERSGATAVSTKGAVGEWQVTQGFFQQYAHQGESFANETDRAAVAQRGIAALSKQYGGDPQRVAVAYFSGQQNVAPATGAEPAAGPTTTGAKPFVVGDSIGQGVRMAGRLEGNVETGATPDMILHGITGAGGNAVKGRDVVLSSGISNDPRPQQLAVVEQQIDALKAKGAGNITLLGVGSRPDFAGINDRLAQIAQQKGVTFSGPLTNLSPDQVHPANYGPLALSVTQPQASLPSGGVQPHNPAAYGQEAEMMAKAREVAGRLFPVGSAGYNKIVEGRWQEIQQNNQLQQKYEAEQKKAQQDQVEAVGQQVIQQIRQDPQHYNPGMIWDNPALTVDQKQHLATMVSTHFSNVLGDKATNEYGPGFWDAYKQVHAPAQPPFRAGAPVFTVGGQGEQIAPAGLIAPGNLDLNARPVYRNPNGKISTELSLTIEVGGKQVIIPSIVGGRPLTPQQAVEHYRQSGENLGTFDTEEHAEAYANALHERQGATYANAPPQRLTDPSQLWSRAGPGGDLTLAGVDKLTQEIMAKRTPDGDAEGQMKRAFFDAQHVAISLHGLGGTGKDPVGEQKFAQFMVVALSAYDNGRKQGLTPTQLLSDKSPDYIGKLAAPFMRTNAEKMRDYFAGNNPEIEAATGGAATTGAKAPPDLSTIEGLKSAYQAGQFGYGLTGYQAMVNEARKRGLIAAPPTIVPTGP